MNRPECIFIEKKSNQAILADFGVLSDIEKKEETVNVPDSNVINGELGFKEDIFSLGLVLLELVSKDCFRKFKENPKESLQSLLLKEQNNKPNLVRPLRLIETLCRNSSSQKVFETKDVSRSLAYLDWAKELEFL